MTFLLKACLVMNVLIYLTWILIDVNSVTFEIIWVDYIILPKCSSCKYQQWQQNMKST